MIETDHQHFLPLEQHGCFQTLFGKVIKRGLGPKVFPGQSKFSNSYLQNVIHFAKFQLILVSKLGDIIVKESSESLFKVCDVTKSHVSVSILFALILASSKFCNSGTK